MADADAPPDPDATEVTEGGTETTASARWLGGLLWETPPNTEHLKKFQPRTQAAVPDALLEGFAHVESIDVLGLPAGTSIINGAEVEPGTWRLNDDAGGRFAVQSGRDTGADGPHNLTIKVTGAETEGGEVVSLLGSLDLDLPKRHKGPLFRNLPDMVKAREREERQRQAAEKAKQEAERLAAEEAAAQKAAEEAAAQKAAEEAVAQKAAEEAVAQKAAEEAAAKKAAEEEAARQAEAKAAAEKAAARKQAAAAKPQRRPARRAAVTLQPVAKEEPEPAPAATPAPKPQRRAAVTLQRSDPAPEPSQKPRKTQPPRRAQRRAAVTLQPVEPKPEAKPVETPKRRAAVTLQPVEPEKPTPKKSGVTWSKPIRRTAEPAAGAPTAETAGPVETGEPTLPHTERIGVELGGAPEVGDPHFRLLVDGHQVLDGNIDWGIGMPASDTDNGELCWQTREIAWDFTDGAPDTIVLRFDNSGAGQAAEGTLLARAITVDGLSIDADGPYARYPDGRCPWAGRAERLSWHGDLVFNVAGARRGDPDFQPQEPDAADPAPAAAAETPPEEAIALEENPDETDNLDDFDVALADAREIMEIADVAARQVLSGVSDLVLDEPETDPADAIMPIEIPDDLAAILMPPPDGSEIRDVFLAERLARADAERAQHSGVEEDAPPPLHQIPPEEGQQLREAFLTAWEIRADTHGDGVTVIDLPGEAPTASVAMTSGRAVGDEFLTGRLKTALQYLQTASKAPTAAGETPPQQAGARAEAAALSAAFLDEALARARAQMTAPA